MSNFAFLISAVLLLIFSVPAFSENRVTILYDAFSKSDEMQRDWGFSAFIEFNGQRILFDSGNNAEIFRDNIAKSNIDLSRVDYAVISHRHGDHTTGLNHLLKINPHVPVYAPDEKFGLFGGHIRGSFYKRDTKLPKHMQIYVGQPPKRIQSGTPWSNAEFNAVKEVTEVSDGVFILPNVSRTVGTMELKELSLALKTKRGMVLIVGCSHPGITNIIAKVKEIDPRVHNVFGGFHLLNKTPEELSRITSTLKEEYQVENIAPGHCTGEPAFGAFSKSFGDRYVYAGLGESIEIP